MLGRRIRLFYSKRSYANPFSYKVTEPSQETEELSHLRNTDYQIRRKAQLEKFNTQLKIINRSFKEEMEQIKKNFKGDDEVSEQQKEDQKSIILDKYKGNTDSIASQLRKQLQEIDSQQKTNTVKLYLAENLQRQHQGSTPIESPSSTQMYIPNRLVLKKLYLGPQKQAQLDDTSKQVLLVGVQKEEDHCLFLMKLLQEFQIKNVVTMVSPDLPYFIKTEDSFMTEWKKFIQNPLYAKKSKFYVNPRPKILQDVCLHSYHFSLVREALSRSSSFLDTYYYLMKQNEMKGSFEPLPLLGGLCSQGVDKIYLGDFPVYQERRMLADHMELNALRGLFQEFLRNFRKMQVNFSAEWLFPPDILRKKLSHIVKVAKAVGSSNKGRTMLLCPTQMAELIGLQWQLGKGTNEGLNFQCSTQGVSPNQTFMQHIQKLVILDLIIDPVITRYFVKFRSFPFMCEHTIGGKQNIGKIFIVWMHFYNLYYQQLSAKRLQTPDQQILRKSIMQRYENPTNFT